MEKDFQENSSLLVSKRFGQQRGNWKNEYSAKGRKNSSGSLQATHNNDFVAVKDRG